MFIMFIACLQTLVSHIIHSALHKKCVAGDGTPDEWEQDLGNFPSGDPGLQVNVSARGAGAGFFLLNVASSRAPEGQTFEVASQPVGDVHDLYRGKHMDHMANRSDRNCCFYFWD